MSYQRLQRAKQVHSEVFRTARIIPSASGAQSPRLARQARPFYVSYCSPILRRTCSYNSGETHKPAAIIVSRGSFTAVIKPRALTAADRYRNAAAIGRAHASVAVSWLSSANVGTRLPRKRSSTAARALRNITRSACCCKTASCSCSDSVSTPA
jgi:hypothetical protein